MIRRMFGTERNKAGPGWWAWWYGPGGLTFGRHPHPSPGSARTAAYYGYVSAWNASEVR